MMAVAQDEHRWLLQLVGDWTFESACSGEPGQESKTYHGGETVRALGELWIVAEGSGEMPGGGEARMNMTLGYDPAKGRFVGTWVGSMMTHLWVYEGELDDAKRVLSLHAEGPAMNEKGEPTGKSAKYKDVIEIVNENERKLSGWIFGEDGQWHQMMEACYRRK